MRLTDQGRKTVTRLGIAVLIVLSFAGLRYAARAGYGRQYMPSFMVPKIALDDQLQDAGSRSGGAAALASLPGSKVAALSGAPDVRVNFWAWNAQMGCLYANGGSVTTDGSLMAKQGVHMTIDRQDDNNQLMAQLTALAKAMHDGQTDPKVGVHFVGIMGDGAGAFLAALNSELTKSLGADYRAEIIGSCGYSRGEDKLMGPAQWKSNPQSMRGALVAAVVRDGDWNIAQRYAGDNGIPNNPDETTYDAGAINWVNTSSYTDAAEKYVQGYCEDRKVVTDGKPTGATKHVCVDGAATWTPGDVTMAKEKGGVVSVVSTKEYANQMPHVIIGIHKWNQTHRETVEKMLTAFLEGGDQVLSYPQALDRAAEISQEIYNEKGADAAYWKKYYMGVTEPDKTGTPVDLGGSRASNLADNLVLFGLADGTSLATSRFHATYTVFGNLVTKMYPKLVPSVPTTDEILDVSYLRAVGQKAPGKSGAAETQTYAASSTPVKRVVGRRNVAIQFQTGSSALAGEGERQLEQLFNELSINALAVEVHGHTDNQGSAEANQQLSEDRGLAVKNWLEHRSAATFPANRVRVFAHGATEPVASNKTAEGRAANRRVEIVIGQ
jgi:OmpA-OmpF porin, OOP family